MAPIVKVIMGGLYESFLFAASLVGCFYELYYGLYGMLFALY